MKYTGPRVLSKRHLACVTLQCNARCIYCYYAQKCDQYSHWPEMIPVDKRDVFRPLKELKDELRFNVENYGTDTQDLFGGEPTIHPNIVEYTRFSVQELGIPTRVVSNGLKLSRRTFFKKMHDAGCRSAMLTVHGMKPETHDLITGVKGSHERILRVYDFCNEYGWTVMSNVVPIAQNHDELYEVADYVLSITANPLNFDVITLDSEMFRPEECAHLCRPMTEQAMLIKNIVDLCFRRGVNYQICGGSETSTVRYVPFCLYRGYEHVVSGYHQLPYNHKEWSYNTYQPAYRGMLHTEKDYMMVADGIVSDHYWSDVCKGCAARGICVGVRSAVRDVPGNREFHLPYEGEPITDPWHFKENLWVPPKYRRKNDVNDIDEPTKICTCGDRRCCSYPEDVRFNTDTRRY